jgi:hypothetical protein
MNTSILDSETKQGVNTKDFSIECVGNHAVIRVNLSLINIESLNKLIERLRFEELIKRAKFGDEVTEIGREIKKNWWQKNRDEYLKGIISADCY